MSQKSLDMFVRGAFQICTPNSYSIFVKSQFPLDIFQRGLNLKSCCSLILKLFQHFIIPGFHTNLTAQVHCKAVRDMKCSCKSTYLHSTVD